MFIFYFRSKALTHFQVSGYISRFSHTSHTVRKDQLVLIGGVSNAQEPGIALVDLATKTCRECSLEKVPFGKFLLCYL